MPKIRSIGTFFKFDLFLTSCDLQWPLMIFRVKISYHILVGDIIRVCIQKKIDPWEHFIFLLKLTLVWPFWPKRTFTYPWWYYMSMLAKNCIWSVMPLRSDCLTRRHTHIQTDTHTLHLYYRYMCLGWPIGGNSSSFNPIVLGENKINGPCKSHM